MSFEIPRDMLKITTNAEEYRMLEDLKERRLYLYREIEPLGYEETSNMLQRQPILSSQSWTLTAMT